MQPIQDQPKCQFNPGHRLWVVDWEEPCGHKPQRARTFKSYTAACQWFEKLDSIGLHPAMLGFKD